MKYEVCKRKEKENMRRIDMECGEKTDRVKNIKCVGILYQPSDSAFDKSPKTRCMQVETGHRNKRQRKCKRRGII
jgi:hypothetical protein